MVLYCAHISGRSDPGLAHKDRVDTGQSRPPFSARLAGVYKKYLD
jgi:hypothetical protein